MEQQKVSSLVVMDLSAAFNTEDHDILLEVLSARYEVNGKALHWFEIYIRPRYCQVDVQGKRSCVKRLDLSVVQGSCLDVVLYNTCASTLETVVPNDLDHLGFIDNQSLNKGLTLMTLKIWNIALMTSIAGWVIIDWK